jgi:hypothetical protein
MFDFKVDEIFFVFPQNYKTKTHLKLVGGERERENKLRTSRKFASYSTATLKESTTFQQQTRFQLFLVSNAKRGKKQQQK